MQAGASLGHVSGVPLLTEEGGLAEWGALDDVVMVRGGREGRDRAAMHHARVVRGGERRCGAVWRGVGAA